MKDFNKKVTENTVRSWSVCYGLCKSCGLCIEKCPVKSISWSESEVGIYGSPGVINDIERCIACGKCALICPESAIKVKKKQ